MKHNNKQAESSSRKRYKVSHDFLCPIRYSNTLPPISSLGLKLLSIPHNYAKYIGYSTARLDSQFPIPLLSEPDSIPIDLLDPDLYKKSKRGMNIHPEDSTLFNRTKQPKSSSKNIKRISQPWLLESSVLVNDISTQSIKGKSLITLEEDERLKLKQEATESTLSSFDPLPLKNVKKVTYVYPTLKEKKSLVYYNDNSLLPLSEESSNLIYHKIPSLFQSNDNCNYHYLRTIQLISKSDTIRYDRFVLSHSDDNSEVSLLPIKEKYNIRGDKASIDNLKKIPATVTVHRN